MNSTTKKLLIFGGIVAVIIIIIALKKKQDEEMENGDGGDAKLPSVGLVPANIVPFQQDENTGTSDAASGGDNNRNTLLVEGQILGVLSSSHQPESTKGNDYTGQYYDIRKGKNFFDGMKC